MNLRQVEFFVAVVDEGGFTAAADRLGVAQSTVSAGLLALERSLGGPLLDRSTRALTLTSLGRRSLPAARELVAAASRLRHGGQEATTLRGRLRLGVISNLGFLDLPRLVSTYQRRHPHVDVSLRLHPQGSTGLVADTRQGRLDLAVVGGAPDTYEGLVAVPVATRTYVALVPSGHRVAGRESVRLRDLAGDPFVDLPPGFGTRDRLDAAFDARGIARRIAVEVPDQTSMPDYVRAGLGVAVTTAPHVDLRGLTEVPVADLDPQRTVLVHREEAPPVVAPMVALVAARGRR